MSEQPCLRFSQVAGDPDHADVGSYGSAVSIDASGDRVDALAVKKMAPTLVRLLKLTLNSGLCKGSFVEEFP